MFAAGKVRVWRLGYLAELGISVINGEEAGETACPTWQYQWFARRRRFRLPRWIGLVVVHGGGPGRFIIGDGESLLHKRTVIRLNVQ